MSKSNTPSCRRSGLGRRDVLAMGVGVAATATCGLSGAAARSPKTRGRTKKHPFRVAIENGAEQEELAKLFSPNVVLMAPMLSKPVIGVSKVLSVITSAAQLGGPIKYTLEVSDSRQTFLFWDGEAGGYPLQASTILVDGEDGLIREVRVVMRPWPVSTIFRNAMHDKLAGEIPEDYWVLGPKSDYSGKPRSFTPIALQSIEMSTDVVLHSPILAKEVSGKDRVEASLKLAHQVQSRSSYTSIIATPEVLVELFDCDADGYPMEGIWLQKLNSQRQIYELTVFLRPYPAVTVLRNKAKELAGEAGLLDAAFWELS